jgi:hypothetical protein
MKFIELPIPVDERVPEGYILIVAYAKGENVVTPVTLEEGDEYHNCDAEGCGSLDHVVSMNVKSKYDEREKHV